MLLKKNKWWIYLLLNVITLGLINFVMADMMELYGKNAWYTKRIYWFSAAICFIFPVILMFIIFLIQISVKVAHSLNVDGDKIYDNVYVWILCLIIPIVGWIILIVMYLYINVFSAVAIYNGNGEKYLL